MSDVAAPAAPTAPAAPSSQSSSDFFSGLRNPAPAAQTAPPVQDPAPQAQSEQSDQDQLTEQTDQPTDQPQDTEQPGLDDAAATQRWRDLESAMDLPEDLHEKLVAVPVKDGEPEYKTIKQLIAGNLRQSEYSRQMNASQQAEAQAVAVIKRQQQWGEAIKDHNFLLKDLRERVGYDVVLNLAREVSRENRASKQLAEAAGHAAGQAEVDRMIRQYGVAEDDPRLQDAYRQAYGPAKEQALKMQAEQRARESELTQLRRQAQELERLKKQTNEKREVQQTNESVDRAAAQLMPPAFKTYGLDPKNQIHQMKFYRNLHEYCQTLPKDKRPSSMTKELALIGAEMTREELDDQARREGAASTKTLPVQRRGSQAAPSATLPGAAPTTSSDFFKKLKS